MNTEFADKAQQLGQFVELRLTPSLLTRQFALLRLTQEFADKAAAAGAICSVEINTDFADKAQQW